IDDYGNSAGVFRGGANHRWSTDVDLFDCFFACYTLASDRLRKRIEIHNDHIDRLDAVLLHRGNVFRVIAQSQQTPVNARMKSFDASIHHLGKTRHVRNIAHVNPGVTQNPGAAAGADDFHVEMFEFASEVDDSGFVRDTDKGAFDWFHLTGDKLIMNLCVRE